MHLHRNLQLHIALGCRQLPLLELKVKSLRSRDPHRQSYFHSHINVTMVAGGSGSLRAQSNPFQLSFAVRIS